MSNNVPAIEIRNFGKKYTGNKNYSVKNASFIVKEGEMHGFIGANGAGKTTTIKSIIGAYARYEGEILIYGKKNSLKDAKKYIGYIPERALFPKGFSTFAYLKNIGMVSGLSAKQAKEIAIQKLTDMNLLSLKNRNPNKFSSGQQKKVFLAQALLHNPKIIIMDEPAANLDPKARKDFFQELMVLTKSGITVFISSHILDELDKYVDSVTIIENGNIAFSGKVNDASLTNENTWDIKVNNNDEAIKILETHGIKNIEKINQILRIKANDSEISKIFQKLVSSKNVDLNSVKSFGKDLISIYEHYVQVGSMDANTVLGKN